MEEVIGWNWWIILFIMSILPRLYFGAFSWRSVIVVVIQRRLDRFLYDTVSIHCPKESKDDD